MSNREAVSNKPRQMNRLITTGVMTTLFFWCAATVHAADDPIAASEKHQEQFEADAFKNASPAKWQQVFFRSRDR
jgi:hypothetical protein